MVKTKGVRTNVRTTVWRDKPVFVYDYMDCLMDTLITDIKLIELVRKTKYEVEYKGKKTKATFNVGNSRFEIHLTKPA